MHSDEPEVTNACGSSDTEAIDDPYLTVEQAAKRLKIKRDTLDRWRMNGAGPVFRYHGGRVVYHIEELDAWSDSQRQTQARKFKRKKKNDENNGGAS